MSHLSGGVIHLDEESDAGVEEVGSDVEEVVTRVGSRKVSMGFLRERDFSRDQPCETRLLARLESRMVSWEKFAEVVGTRRVLGERHILYLTSYVRTEQVWSRMSRETGLARRDHGLAVLSCVSSRTVSQRDATLVVTWDHKLCGTKMFSTGFLILSGRRFDSPNLDEQQKILFSFIDQPAHDYFLSRSQQSRVFEELKIVCKLGWTESSVTSRKKKWNVHFVVEHLAILLVLRRQVEKEKEARVDVERSTRSASKGVPKPKATPLKRAFRKLWAFYEPSLKLYTQAERDAENVVHRTPSLSLQLTGARDQDHVPWGKWMRYESNSALCAHTTPRRCQCRDVMDKMFDAATTPQTKRVVAKVHAQLAQKDAIFTTVVNRYQDFQSSQEISSTCIDLQRALG